MENKIAYRQLTNVDIDKQRMIWDERGKGYYGEYLLFCELYNSITGTGKILMNLNVPVDDSKTTEIDLILIHETGVYVFEIKHYKGTIYGKDTDDIWTQYFKTVKNNTFKNPIKQNKYHINALNKLLPNVPIHSCIVFTSNECNIKINNSDNKIDTCLLRNIKSTLDYRFLKNPNKLSMDDINDIFVKLSNYSQMIKPIKIDDTEADFFSWVQPVISKLEEKKQVIENEKNAWIANSKKLKKTKIIGIFFNIVVAILCIVISIYSCFLVIKKNNNELAKFKQNFLHIDEIDNEYIDALNSYVDISNIELLPLTDDAISFTARISTTNDTYGIAITENSRYIVMTTSGKVMEYNVFGEHLKYNRYSNIIGKGYRNYGDLAKIQFYGIYNINDISYIKITDIELFKLDINKTVIKDKLEIELYSK